MARPTTTAAGRFLPAFGVGLLLGCFPRVRALGAGA
jgi:hypothetical protein